MVTSEFENFQVIRAAKQFCAEINKYVPQEQIYIDYKIDNQALYLLEIRPVWNNPEKTTEQMVAKFLYTQKDKKWKLYWQRQNTKWVQYKSDDINLDLEFLLEIVEEDSNGCFWG